MKRKRNVPIPEATVDVIVDTRNGKLDRVVPKALAKQKYDAGELAWDVTNGKYCTPLENGREPQWLTQFRKRG